LNLRSDILVSKFAAFKCNNLCRYTLGHLGGLEHLDLSCNVLGPAGCAALAPLLAHTHDDDVGDDDGDVSDDEGGGGGGGGGGRRRMGLYSLDLAVNNCAVDGERSGIKALMKVGLSLLGDRLGCHSRVTDCLLHGTYWVSSIECVLTHNNNVKSANPGCRRLRRTRRCAC
jgi:hypothetical protein